MAGKWLISQTGRNGTPQAGTVGNALQNRCTATVLTRPFRSAKSVRGSSLPHRQTRCRADQWWFDAHEFVQRDRSGVRNVDRRLLSAGRQPREVIAAFAHEPPHAAALGAKHERDPLA